MTAPENYSRDAKEPVSKDESSEPNLYEQESKPDNDSESDAADSAEKSQIGGGGDNDSLYEPGDKPKKSTTAKVVGLFAGKRKWAWLGGGFGILSIMMMSFFTASLELVHIKELLNLEVGETSETVLSDRTRRVYNRMYFFRDDGKFDGYRDMGMFGFLENKQTTKVLDEMRSRGFEIEPETAPDGRWTGKLASISLDGQQFTDMNNRNAIKNALEQIYPERSRFWRSLQARRLYDRYNLGYLRGGWLRDTRLFTGLESMEYRLRQTLRDTLFGDARNQPRVTLGAGDSGEETTPEEDELRSRLEGVSGDVEEIRNDLLEEGVIREHVTGIDIDAGTLSKATAQGAAGGLIRGVSILGIADSACEVKRFAGLLQAGAVVLRSEQLMSYATIFFSAADAQKAGYIQSDVLGGFMNLIKQDGGGKHGLYASGAYGWLLGKGSTVNPVNRDHYAVGGGFTGPLGAAYEIANEHGSAIGCGVVGNIFVQIGGAIVGIVAGIISGGSSLIASVGISIAISIAAEVAKAIAAPMIAEMLVGNIISWDETGEQYMDALVSGTGALYAANGANFGMKPLAVDEYAQLQKESDKLREENYASTPFWKRLFGYNDTRSLLAQLSLRSPRSLGDVKQLAVDFFTSPVDNLAYGFNDLLSGPVAHARDVTQCPDTLIMENNIATDPFCNPIYGETAEGLAIEPDDNFIYMVDNGHVNESGDPQGVYAEFVDRCVNNYTDYYKQNAAAGSFEFDDYCTRQDPQTLNFRAFSAYKPLVEAIDAELNGVVGAPGFMLP